MGRYPQMRRRSLTAEAIAVRRMRRGAARDAVESTRIAGEARVGSIAPGCPPPARRVRGTATPPQRTLPPPRRRAEHHRRNACDTETRRRGGHAGEQTEASRRDQTRENRRSQAERTGGGGAGGLGRHHPRAAHRQGPHPLLPRHRRRGAQSAGRGRADADRHGLGRRDRRDRRARVHDARRRGASVDPGPRALPETTLGVPARTDRARHRTGQRAGGLHPAQHVHRTAQPR